MSLTEHELKLKGKVEALERDIKFGKSLLEKPGHLHASVRGTGAYKHASTNEKVKAVSARLEKKLVKARAATGGRRRTRSTRDLGSRRRHGTRGTRRR